MTLNFKLLAASLVCTMVLQAQTPKRSCGTPVPDAQWDVWFNQKVQEHKQALASGKVQTSYVIPVVVHIIHGGQPVGNYPNISQAQVNSQIPIMNADFAGTGLNVGNLAATAFSAVGAANCGISFCMAQLDPSGNVLVEPGIDRINFNTMGWSNPATINSTPTFQAYVDNNIKPATIWDPTLYFNIWVTDHNNTVDLLGYATFPTGTGLTGIFNGNGTSISDGIWVWSKSFGNVGTLSPPYNKGRTASHETGHWLGLRHIGGDGNGNVAGDCNATDYCNDTPPQLGGFSTGQYGQNFGAPTYPLYATGPNSCPAAPNGCMFMNFMDYVDDAFCYMFTPDQSARMNAAMANGTFRSQLTASSATLCNLPSTMPVAAFSIPPTTCADSIIVINNRSTGSPMPSYAWSASPTLPGIIFSPNNTSASPTIKFITPATYTVTMAATNAAGTNTTTQVITVTDCSLIDGISKSSALGKYVMLSPNPSSGVLNITTALSANQNLEVVIHNYLGQYITAASYKDVTTNKYSLDLSSYANGVYFVTISNGQEKVVKRLILNK